MALPQKVIEQLGREPATTPGWSGQLLMFTSTLFFISLFVYLGLAFGYSPYLSAQENKVQDQIQAFSQQIPVDQQVQLANFYSQISNLRTLLADHVISSPVFAWLEKNTEANIYFNKFSLTPSTSQLEVGGNAPSLDDVDQQLLIFKSQPEIQRIEIGSITLSNNVWQFDFTLHFNPGYFYASGKPIPAAQ